MMIFAVLGLSYLVTSVSAISDEPAFRGLRPGGVLGKKGSLDRHDKMEIPDDDERRF